MKKLTKLAITLTLWVPACAQGNSLPHSSQEYLEYYNMLLMGDMPKKSAANSLRASVSSNNQSTNNNDTKKILGISIDDTQDTVLAQMLADLRHTDQSPSGLVSKEAELKNKIAAQQTKIADCQENYTLLAQVNPNANELKNYTKAEKEAQKELFRLEKLLFEELKNKLYEQAYSSLKIKDEKNNHFLLYPLHEAIRLAMEDCVVGLLHTPIYPDAFNHVGKKPIHVACEKITDETKAVSIIKKLIAAGVNVNTPSRLGDNPLYYALANNKYAVGDLLIEYGSADNPGPLGSVLPFLVKKKFPEQKAKSFFISLVARGANPNLKLSDGNNLLYKALVKKKFDLAQAILTCGGVDNDGPGGSVEEMIKARGDLALTSTFTHRRNQAPVYLESWDNYSPRTQ